MEWWKGERRKEKGERRKEKGESKVIYKVLKELDADVDDRYDFRG
ncbi:hypothetical protein [Marinifilum flexuosum]|nr:hypothetical protein [Marinifilum flexuosum]